MEAMKRIFPLVVVFSVLSLSASAKVAFSWNDGDVDGWTLAKENQANNVSYQDRSDRTESGLNFSFWAISRGLTG